MNKKQKQLSEQNLITVIDSNNGNEMSILDDEPKYAMKQINPYMSYNEKRSLFLEAVKLFDGNIGEACNAIGIHRQTYWDWQQKDIDLNDMVKQIVLSTVDEIRYLAVSSLRQRIAGIKRVAKKEAINKEGQVLTLTEERYIEPSDISIMFALNNTGQSLGYNNNKSQDQTNYKPLKLPDYLTLEESTVEE
jgi:hypothetical protein